jgi:mono/diheme cytochrome c family protein
MKQFCLGVLSAILLTLVLALAYLRLGLAEVRTDVAPSRLESAVMQMAVHASVRRQAPEVRNPVQPTEENLIAGAKMYLDECSGCHGTPGKQQKFTNSLYPAAPQFAEAGTTYSEAQIFWVAKHGIRRTGMFANGVWDADQKLWTMAAFLYRVRNLPPRVNAEIENATKGRD